MGSADCKHCGYQERDHEDRPGYRPGRGCGNYEPEDLGRADWLVCPVSRTRDTADLLEVSNWEAQLEALGGEGPDAEVHRFGHWGPGWFELVLVRPGTPAETKAEEIAGALEEYPVLDDEDHSRREYEAQLEGVRDQAGPWVRDNARDGWEGRVLRWKGWTDCRDGRPEDYTRPGGGGPSDADMRRCLRALRLMEPKYHRVRWLGLRKVTRPGFAPFYRDIRVRNYNPAYPL